MLFLLEFSPVPEMQVLAIQIKNLNNKVQIVVFI